MGRNVIANRKDSWTGQEGLIRRAACVSSSTAWFRWTEGIFYWLFSSQIHFLPFYPNYELLRHTYSSHCITISIYRLDSPLGCCLLSFYLCVFLLCSASKGKYRKSGRWLGRKNVGWELKCNLFISREQLSPLNSNADS